MVSARASPAKRAKNAGSAACWPKRGCERSECLPASVRKRPRTQARAGWRRRAFCSVDQIERGLHQPSLRVLRSIAQALSIAPEELLRRANFLSASTHADDAGAGADTERADGADTGRRATGADAGPDTEAAIVSDPKLTPRQREALLNVYRSFRDSG